VAHHERDSAARTPDVQASGARAGDARTPDERRADHATIDRLADEMLPALVAKLGASGLGELDVREGAWRVRLRMPADGRPGRRTTGRGAGRADGHAPAGHAPGGHASPAPATGGPLHEPATGTPTGDPQPPDAPVRAIATSPAVGFFRPSPDRSAGDRVRAGDRLGSIDVLGVLHELVAPVDGIVGATLVEAGEPVEYGQDLVEVELLDGPSGERAEDA